VRVCRTVLRTSDGCLEFGRLELCNLETLQSVAPGILPASVLRESADQSRRDAGATTVETLKQEKGVPIPRHALLSANRHDGERMASPVPFALRFTPQRCKSPIGVVRALGCDICGRNWPRPGLLEPSGCAEVVVDFDKFGAISGPRVARASHHLKRQLIQGRSMSCRSRAFAARASFPVRKKLRHGV